MGVFKRKGRNNDGHIENRGRINTCSNQGYNVGGRVDLELIMGFLKESSLDFSTQQLAKCKENNFPCILIVAKKWFWISNKVS